MHVKKNSGSINESNFTSKKMSQTGLKKINESNRSITLIFEDNWGNKNMFKPLEL